MAPRKIRTMMEFCNAIGLSRPTVSRYFNNPELVRISSRKIIEQGLEEFGYTPNFHAANLQRAKTKALGIVVPSIVDPFFSALVTAIEIYAEERGYLTILQCSYHDPKMESRALKRLQSMNVTGIAMSPIGSATNLATVDNVHSDTPIIFMDSRLSKDSPYIGTNNKHSISLMVDYLCATGKPPVILTLPRMNFNIAERQQAYCDHMEFLGHEPVIVNPDPLASISGPEQFEKFGMDQFFALASDQLMMGTTILCINDRVAFGVLAAATIRGLKVGKQNNCDLRIAGHDNQFFSQFTSPQLTTVRQNTTRIGTLAAQALLEPANNVDLWADGRLLDGELIIRDSA